MWFVVEIPRERRGNNRLQAQPEPVGGRVPARLTELLEEDVCKRNDMLGPVVAAAAEGGEAPALVAVIVHLQDGDRFADDMGIGRQVCTLPERFAERHELLVLIMGIDDDLREQRLQVRFGEVVLLVCCHLLNPHRGGCSP